MRDYQSEILLEGVRGDSLFGSGVVQEVYVRRFFTSGTSRTEIKHNKLACLSDKNIPFNKLISQHLCFTA